MALALRGKRDKLGKGPWGKERVISGQGKEY